MDTGVKFEIIWSDDDLVEVRVHASNGRFAGTVDCYGGHDEIPRIIEAVRGFPTSSEDRRELEIGTFDPDFAGGGARLVLRCADAAGHAVADVTVRADPCGNGWPAETASFSVPVEPAAIDEFVVALGSMSSVVGTIASLRQAT
ncbi:MAG: hypothetical protein R3F30_13220 [Planctomycetota bacterium]